MQIYYKKNNLKIISKIYSSFEKYWRRFYKQKSNAKLFNIFSFVRAYLDHDCV